MSPTVNNFVHDLVAMAKAMEDLPVVQAERESLGKMYLDAQETIQRLELKLLDKNTEIATLHTIIRATEEARDSAELLFLECDDAKRTLVRFLEDASKDIAGVLSAVAPIPTPTVEGDAVGVVRDEVKPKAEAERLSYDWEDAIPQGQSALDPTSAPTPISSAPVPTDAPTVEHGSTDEGVSVQPDPSLAIATTPMADAGPQSFADTSTDASADPYADEPAKYTNAWYDWASEMDKKYNFSWPSRKPVSPVASPVDTGNYCF